LFGKVKLKNTAGLRTLKVALMGNPNSGKSTLFNALTGMNQQTGNYPGVTVEKHSGMSILKDESTGESVLFTFLDLPGTYSIYPKTLDEQVCFKVLCDTASEDRPDLVIIVADATNLRRSLFLASQVIDLGYPSIFVMNMIDFARLKGLEINKERLSALLGIPVVATNARKKTGVDKLKKLLLLTPQPPAKSFIDINEFTPAGMMAEASKIFPGISNYATFQLVNNEAGITYFETLPYKKNEIKSLITSYHFEKHKILTEETIARYKTINEIIKECVTINEEEKRKSLTARIDKFLLNRVWGYLFFLCILFVIFQSIFFIAKYPMDGIEFLFIQISKIGSHFLPAGELSSLIINGILAGLSGVVVFVPQIALLFAFIAILEDTGYMARASYIMDRLMRPFGLNGRSVIPLMGGMACAVPSILGTRTIPNYKERLITIMVTPLMSCSARLPVYTLLIALVIPSTHNYGYFNMQGLVLMGLYLVGFLSALAAAFIFKLFVRSREKSHFIMEMPLYRIPKPAVVGMTIYHKTLVFLRDAGKVIIAISVILWFMASHGPPSHFKYYESAYHRADSVKKYGAEQVNNFIASEKLKNSYAGMAGRYIEPVIKPIGFDWKIGIALITSFAAREVFVGTMATLYSAGGNNNNLSIREKMASAVNPETGKKEYSVAVGFSLMLFYAFAMQCMSTLAVVYRETQSLKWPIIQFIYMGLLAWLASFIVYSFAK
jgi:ferrous iron transport protein B